MKLSELENLLTLENALAWHASEEKTAFVCDLAGISCDSRFFSYIESWFEVSSELALGELK